MLEKITHLLEQNSPSRWLLALGMAAATFTALSLLKRLILRVLTRQGEDSPGNVQRGLHAVAANTTLPFVAAAGAAAGASLLSLPHQWDEGVGHVLMLAGIWQLGYWLHHIIHLTANNLGGDNGALDPPRESARNLLRLFSVTLLWAAVGLLALENLGVNVSSLVAGLGVTGVAVALATQNIVGDLFASISILLDKPFLVGDYIVLDAFAGTVERIGLRTTRLRSLSGEEIILANGDLSKNRIRNYRSMPERRIVFTFGVPYETPVPALKAIKSMVRDSVQAVEHTRFERAQMLNFASSWLEFEVCYYVRGNAYTTYTEAQEAINFRIMEGLAEASVVFAYPAMTVYPTGSERFEARPPGTARAGAPRQRID